MEGTHTRDSGGKQANGDVQRDLEAIRRDLSELRNQLSSLANDTVTAGRDAANAGYRAARDRVDNVTQTVDEYVRDKPLVSLGIAVGLGAVLGAVLRR